jgi:tetratricopeptide (TPR) repeat protein
VYALAGPVPALGWGELVGRRRELRVTLRALREDPRFTAAHGTVGGVALTGTGGVGKSSVAGRVGTRLSEDGWVCSATQGAWSLDAIYQALSFDLAEASSPWAATLHEQLGSVPQDDAARLAGLERALRRHPLLLILDNFEDNLTPDGGAFLDPTTGAVLSQLLNACAVGKLLITSRYPLPSVDAAVHHETVGPLSPAETRRLFLRLEGLKRLDRDDVALVGSLIGGHPRVLEFLDALLRRGASVDRVRPKLQQLARDEHVELHEERDLPTAIRDAARLGAADIFLEELLKTLDPGEQEVLLQTAVSSLPVPIDDLAETLEQIGIASEATRQAADRLTALSLLVPVGDAIWAHRWTAQALLHHQTEDDYRTRCHRAGDLRMRRLTRASRDVEEGIEATENYLAAGALDAAAGVGFNVAETLAAGSMLRTLSFVAEVRRALPPSHPDYKLFADHEAQALMVLGFTRDALERYRELVQVHERRARDEPDHPDIQHDLAVSYSRFGEVMSSLQKSEQALDLFTKSYEIRSKLAADHPDQSRYLRSYMVACERLGTATLALGDGTRALELFSESVEISKALAGAEPDVSNHRHDVAVGLNKLGEAMAGFGDLEQARDLLEEGLDTIERLAAEMPERSDYLRLAGVSCGLLAPVVSKLGDTDGTWTLLVRDLAITRELRAREPDRADYQLDEAVTCLKLGDVATARGDIEQAWESFANGLAVTERLAEREPERADLLYEIAVFHERLGTVLLDRGEDGEALDRYSQSLRLSEALAAREPDRADYQFALALAMARPAHLIAQVGRVEDARELLVRGLAIVEQLVAREPTRASYLDLRSAVQERLDALSSR